MAVGSVEKNQKNLPKSLIKPIRICYLEGMTNNANFHPACFIPDTDTRAAIDILRQDWHECPTCGGWVNNDDTTTVCDPKKIKEHARYLAAIAKRELIEARMDQRRKKFEAAQAKDMMLIAELRRVAG